MAVIPFLDHTGTASEFLSKNGFRDKFQSKL
jgi:hypothetical protein